MNKTAHAFPTLKSNVAEDFEFIGTLKKANVLKLPLC